VTHINYHTTQLTSGAQADSYHVTHFPGEKCNVALRQMY